MNIETRTPENSRTPHKLDDLSARAREVHYAEGARASAVLDALLAGHSQREVAKWGELAVNTVRSIMQDAGIKYAGPRYEQEA